MDRLSGASFTNEDIAGDLGKHGSAEFLGELPRFGDLDGITEENAAMRKSQMSFTGKVKADDSLIQL